MKYHFFASMSNEVQFEFTEEPPMIVLSDWSDHKLDLPEIIMDPYNDEAFCATSARRTWRSSAVFFVPPPLMIR